MGVDPDALAEAVEWWEANRDGIYVVRTADDQRRDGPLVDAARAVFEAPTAEWCWKHSDAAKWGHETYSGLVCDNAWHRDEPDCEVGRVRLVAEESADG